MTRPKPTGAAAFWTYDELDVNDDVKLKMPDDWKVRVFKVHSGDSGQNYFVQIIYAPGNQTPIYLCNCVKGYFCLPVAILKLEICCKHAENLKQWMLERKK